MPKWFAGNLDTLVAKSQSSYFGDVSNDFAMDNVNCIGNETYIWRCPHETEDNFGGHEAMGVVCSNGDEAEGSGAGSGQVEVAVVVKSATTGGGVDGVPVTLTVDNLVLSEITNIEGVAVFTLSADYVGMWATIVMETEGYATVTIVREIIAGELI